jgi:hypothetical protein
MEPIPQTIQIEVHEEELINMLVCIKAFAQNPNASFLTMNYLGNLGMRLENVLEQYQKQVQFDLSKLESNPSTIPNSLS